MAFSGWQLLITVFAARDIDFTCIDELPIIDPILSNYSKSLDENFSIAVFDNSCIEKCSLYVYEEGVSSVIKEFHLDCGPKSYFKNFVHAPYWLGAHFFSPQKETR